MNKKNIKWIVDATKNRLRYHNISLIEKDIAWLESSIGVYTDSDFKEVSDTLTQDIYQTLLSFGVSDIVAFRCSWKWSD